MKTDRAIKAHLKKSYLLLAIIGLLFVVMFSNTEKRMVFSEQSPVLYEFLYLIYLFTTVLAVFSPVLVGRYFFRLSRKSVRVTTVDVFFYAILVLQLCIWLFVREFDWAFD